MKIELKEITVREVAEGYQDSAEKGVTGYIIAPFLLQNIFQYVQRRMIE